MNNEKHFGLRIEEDLLRKFRYVCSYKGRSANAQILQLIYFYVDRFEEKHGTINECSSPEQTGVTFPD